MCWQLLVSEKPVSMMNPATKVVVRGPGFEAKRVDKLCFWKHPAALPSPQTHVPKGVPWKTCPMAEDVHDTLNLHDMCIQT